MTKAEQIALLDELLQLQKNLDRLLARLEAEGKDAPVLEKLRAFADATAEIYQEVGAL